MSEFTKLGGYLIQGQPEIVHDSALSGNGLEGSPLGLSEEFITGTMRPVGTMNESAFEYDTSNNITAYNGSAIGGITYTTGTI